LEDEEAYDLVLPAGESSLKKLERKRTIRNHVKKD